MAGRQRRLRDGPNEFRLRDSVGFLRLSVYEIEARREALFGVLVSPRDLSVLTQIVPKGERCSLHQSARFHDVDMMGVRPGGWVVEERAEPIILMRNVLVSQHHEATTVECHRMEARDGNLDVDDRLGGETGNRRRAMMIDAQGDLGQGGDESVALSLECCRPVGVVGNETVVWHRRSAA